MSDVSDDQIRVLHVDDEPEFSKLTANLLERVNRRIRVESAVSPSEGLERLEESEFDCILSDYEMPGQDGIEFLETVRDSYPELPFILFTGKGSEEIASKAISTGVTDYLQKDSGAGQYELLANRIENAVERTRVHQDQRRHLDAIESAQEGIAILDENGYFQYVNRSYADLYGYDPEELIGNHWEVLYLNKDINYIRDEVLPRVWETGYWHGTTTGLRSDGSTILEDHVLTVTDRGELICTVRDMTDRDTLQQQFELIAEASTDAFWLWDPKSDEITRSKGYLAQYGYDESDIAEETQWWRDRIHPEDRKRVFDALSRAVTDPGSTYDETYRFRKKDGSYGFLRSRGYVIYGEDGEPKRMVGAHIDITETKQRERMLTDLHGAMRGLIRAESKEEIAKIAVESAEEVVDLPLSAVLLYDDNQHLLRPLAYTEEIEKLLPQIPDIEPDSSIIWRAFSNSDIEVHDDVRDDPAVMNPKTRIRSQVVLPLGRHGVLVCNSMETGDFDQSDVRILQVLSENVKVALERIGREQKLRRSTHQLEQQNKKLERLARIISHDLRNPLNVANGRLSLARETGDKDQLEAVAEAHDRMEAIIENTLMLARHGRTVGDVEPVDISVLAMQCWQGVTPGESTIEIEEEIAVRGDPDRLRHVFENLFRNSVEHGGKSVTVRLGVIDDSGFYVEDDGKGIPDEARDEVFDPGFSTTSEGTGFGLAIVQEIVDAHGWEISVTRSERGGARFEIRDVELL